MARKDNNKESKVSDTMFRPIEDDATLAEILAGARGRGDYRVVLEAFLNSGYRLVEVPLTEGAFAEKKAQTVKTGFENAKSSAKNPVEGASEVKVVKKDDKVYLINNAVAKAA